MELVGFIFRPLKKVITPSQIRSKNDDPVSRLSKKSHGKIVKVVTQDCPTRAVYDPPDPVPW